MDKVNPRCGGLDVHKDSVWACARVDGRQEIEKFGTTTLQPFAEYQLRVGSKLSVTPGLKYAHYTQAFTQFADNGKTVGNLGGAPFSTGSPRPWIAGRQGSPQSRRTRWWRRRASIHRLPR